MSQDSDTDKHRENSAEDSATPNPKQKKWGYAKPFSHESPNAFQNLPKEKLKEITKAGGAATKGISKKHYTKCINCELRFTCVRAFEETKNMQAKGVKMQKEGRNKDDYEYYQNYKMDWARCVYEMEEKKAFREKEVIKYKAFTSMDPKDLLVKIQTVFTKLEKAVEEDPSYTKLANLYYMLVNLYKMKFGDSGVAINVNASSQGTGNPTVDIKLMMKEMRLEKDKEKVVDAEFEDSTPPPPVSNNSEADSEMT